MLLGPVYFTITSMCWAKAGVPNYLGVGSGYMSQSPPVGMVQAEVSHHLDGGHRYMSQSRWAETRKIIKLIW